MIASKQPLRKGYKTRQAIFAGQLYRISSYQRLAAGDQTCWQIIQCRLTRIKPSNPNEGSLYDLAK
ncbi:hypothetical protein AZI09_06140 [Levilactobacillus brevis]|nr:hypothetical protein AZI09_06140 [Levilactobacillus brevis]ARN97744.1 hypothetical protein AZI10_06480 [Levilactobacillus brevis]